MKILLFYCCIILCFSGACKKLVDPGNPKNGVDAASAFSNNQDAAAAVSGMYTQLSGGSFGTGSSSLSLYCALSSDELYSRIADAFLQSLYTNKVNAVTSPTNNLWGNLYFTVYCANSAIDGLNKSTGVSDSIKSQLLGETEFMRAFCYFYLTNLFGAVPMPLEKDYSNNRLLHKTDPTEVYQQIISDLNNAVQLLPDLYKTPLGAVSTERVRPNKAAAIALLARTYLFMGKWSSADSAASEILNNTAVYDTVPLNEVFLKDTKEAIWQLQDVVQGYNTLEGFTFNPQYASTDRRVGLSTSLLNAFENGDKRKQIWTSSFDIYQFADKYKSVTYNAPITEQLSIFRVSEQFLIRAEAKAHLNDFDGALKDLNVIRKRAGLPAVYNITSQDILLDTIIHERRVELFTEWGHRWLDLKRTNKIDAAMSDIASYKNTTWDDNAKLYPIPQPDILLNQNLLPQNPGYND